VSLIIILSNLFLTQYLLSGRAAVSRKCNLFLNVGGKYPTQAFTAFSPRARVKVKYWEINADNLSKAGRSWGCVLVVDSRGQIIFVANAHRSDGKRFVVRADEKLTAFVELESTIRACSEFT
jgi:hypothetical protein